MKEVFAPQARAKTPRRGRLPPASHQRTGGIEHFPKSPPALPPGPLRRFRLRPLRRTRLRPTQPCVRPSPRPRYTSLAPRARSSFPAPRSARQKPASRSRSAQNVPSTIAESLVRDSLFSPLDQFFDAPPALEVFGYSPISSTIQEGFDSCKSVRTRSTSPGSRLTLTSV